MTQPAEVHVHLHVHDNTERFDRLEELMASAAEQLTALQAQLADTAADVLAKIDELTAQLGELSPEAQATMDAIVEAVSSLDTAVGDADGSELPEVPGPVEP